MMSAKTICNNLSNFNWVPFTDLPPLPKDTKHNMHLSPPSSLHSKWLNRAASVCFLLLLTANLSAYQEQGASTEREAARLNNLGTALMSQQLLAPAAEKFSSAYELAPNLTVAKVNQGIALLYLQQLPEAQKALELAAAKSPGDPHVWYALGLLYHNQNEPQKAAAALQKVLAIRSIRPGHSLPLGFAANGVA